MMHALTADEVAANFGRSADWLYRHWKSKLARDGMPAPVSTDPLAWDAAQFYAWLDRDLPAPQKAAAAAYRAAAHAYVACGDPDAAKSLADWRQQFMQRLESEDAA